MASRERIRALVVAVASRRRAVEFDEVCQIVNQIRLLGEVTVKERATTHGYQFTIGSRIVRVKKSARGPMKKPYVDAFVDAMVDLGFYEE